ncbi:MAG: hypothetical protein Q7S43_00500 [bacterium]|nr:hypothetical protein [bacterium]
MARQKVVVEVIQSSDNNLLHVATLLGQKGFEFDPSEGLTRIGGADNFGLHGTVEEKSREKLLQVHGVVKLHDPSKLISIIVGRR